MVANRSYITKKISKFASQLITKIMKKIFTILLFGLILQTNVFASKVQRPKLVIGLVVDQMRWDYLYYYYTDYCNNGLRRLLDNGYSFANTQISYSPAVTAVGHSSIFTGTVPAIHGIAGNYFWQKDKLVYCCEDDNVQGVGCTGKEGKMSPQRMLTTTIGDELRVSTDFRSRVFGVSLKDRAAILPAGHSANAAFWWGTKAGHFISSTYYMGKLPEWLIAFNATHSKPSGYDIKTSTEGVTMTFDMAKAVINNYRLGSNGATDMLTVSVSSTDAIGHKYSTRGKENKQVYMQLDKDIADFLTYLDKNIGSGNYLIFLTADHGAAHNFNYLRENKIPAGGWDWETSTKKLNTHLKTKFGVAPVMGEDNYQFFLNDSIIAKAGLKKEDVIDESVEFLKHDSLIMYAFDYNKLAQITMPTVLKERLVNGYFRDRSGEIGIVTRPQVFGAKDVPSYRGTQHGQPFPYDTHIPFLLYGYNIPQGEDTEAIGIEDIAPTICALLHIQMPDGCLGKPRTLKHQKAIK